MSSTGTAARRSPASSVSTKPRRACALSGARDKAHVRRKFFDAQAAAPDAAKRAMNFILEVYRIERAALDADLLGTPEHLAMRQSRSRAVMGRVQGVARH